MEYLFYILAVLVVGLLCIVAIRLCSGNSKVTDSLSAEQKRRAMPAAQFAVSNRKRDRQNVSNRPITSTAIAREKQRTPIPWGWSNHKAFNRSDDGSAGLSAAMQSLTDRLVREKTLVRNGSRDQRAAESFRALLEDRYAPVSKERMAEIEFTKVKPPLLRDPSEPHDQMDNFGIREAERISAKLRRATALEAQGKTVSKLDDDLRYVKIKDLKQPWGW